jgi:hypothetical protein
VRALFGHLYKGLQHKIYQQYSFVFLLFHIVITAMPEVIVGENGNMLNMVDDIGFPRQIFPQRVVSISFQS